jgi:transposase InsO family protein
MLENWAYAVPYRSSSNRRRQLPVWLHHYNHQRPHASLAGLPPAPRLPVPVNNLVGSHS